MCNACGNICCCSDEFGGCGCEGCDEAECWSDFEDDYYDSDQYDLCACRDHSEGFACVELPMPP